MEFRVQVGDGPQSGLADAQSLEFPLALPALVPDGLDQDRQPRVPAVFLDEDPGGLGQDQQFPVIEQDRQPCRIPRGGRGKPSWGILSM